MKVVIVSGAASASYSEAIHAIQSELIRGGVASTEIQVVASDDLLAMPLPASRLYIALGSAAVRLVIPRSEAVPVLCALIPAEAFEQIRREYATRAQGGLVALFLDQPISRQVELIRLAMPNARRIGLMWSLENQRWAAAVVNVARSRGLQVTSVQADMTQPVFASLRPALKDADALLAVPDRLLYNSNTIQNILLASYKARVPLVAFSPSYVRSGAMLALYSTPEQVGLQAATIAQQLLRGKQVSAENYADDFSVGVNDNVARALGFSLDASELAQALRRSERAR